MHAVDGDVVHSGWRVVLLDVIVVPQQSYNITVIVRAGCWRNAAGSGTCRRAGKDLLSQPEAV